MLVLIKITPWDIRVLIAEDTPLCICNFGKWGACFYFILRLVRTFDWRPHKSGLPKTIWTFRIVVNHVPLIF